MFLNFSPISSIRSIHSHSRSASYFTVVKMAAATTSDHIVTTKQLLRLLESLTKSERVALCHRFRINGTANKKYKRLAALVKELRDVPVYWSRLDNNEKKSVQDDTGIDSGDDAEAEQLAASMKVLYSRSPLLSLALSLSVHQN